MPFDKQAEVRAQIRRREQLIEEAGALSDRRLADRYGLPLAFVKRQAREVRELATLPDPIDLFRDLLACLNEDPEIDYMLFRCDDRVIRIKPLDTAQVQSDGFLGALNRNTTVKDIAAMLED